MRSGWAEIVTLHGEWPWADYTSMGKAVCSGIAPFSFKVFYIPISIFGEGFMAKMKDEGTSGSARRNFDMRP